MRMNRRDQLIETARDYIQRRGYNGFSYADLARDVGIRKASIHHHFPSKGDLGKAVAENYREDFKRALDDIAAKSSPAIEKFVQYLALFRKTSEQDHKVCLCIMLASDHETLPTEVQKQAQQFFLENEDWLTQLIREGQKDRSFGANLDPMQSAKVVISALEGAMIIAESTSDISRLASTGEWLTEALK